MRRDQITAELVTRLVAGQFPRWADLPVIPVEPGGWDNRTFRLGDTMAVRLPSAAGYAAGVAKEHTWLPRLAPQLPLPIPTVLAVGTPGEGYPWPWSVRRWLTGHPAMGSRVQDLGRFGEDVAAFLVALQHVDPAGGPAAGAHSFYRGAALEVYDGETRAAIAGLTTLVDAAAAARVWDHALAASWTGTPVWFHGDVAAGNLLVDDGGHLTAVIDFGTCGVGDPACDLVMAWTMLDRAGRARFRSVVAADDPMWARARGWALWKALITLASPDTQHPDAAAASQTLRELLTADQDRRTGPPV